MPKPHKGEQKKKQPDAPSQKPSSSTFANENDKVAYYKEWYAKY